jgi:hypothetical protein
MKKLYVLIAFISCLTMISAQNEDKEFKSDDFKTIFGGKKIGGYGSLGAGYTQIDNKDAIILNARGGVVLGHILALGLTGTGFMNEKTDNPALNESVSMVGGYGGFFIEPIIFPRYGVHLSFPVTAGMGGISYTTFNDQKDEWHQNNDIVTSQTFFIVEPAAELELNLFKFMRMAIFVSYRYASNLSQGWIEQTGTSKTALNSFSAGMEFKFGKF